jgi:aryl-alcohol dehydrogenase-like predicted oxidoreductase
MHWPAEDGTKLEDYWQTFLDLKAAGKVRAVGLSNHSVEQLERAEERGHVDALQPPFSAIHRDAASALLPWTQRNDTGVIVYSPMMSGLLTGAFNRSRVASLPKDDWRRASADFTTNLDANLAVANALRAVAERHDISQPAAAVAWTLAFDGVTGAIVGARDPKQVDGWLAAASTELTQDDLDTVAAAIAAAGAGEGPVRP